MPDLPTLTVTTAQATRIQAAFGSALEYRKWLRSLVIATVVQRESEAARLALAAEVAEPT